MYYLEDYLIINVDILEGVDCTSIYCMHVIYFYLFFYMYIYLYITHIILIDIYN